MRTNNKVLRKIKEDDYNMVAFTSCFDCRRNTFPVCSDVCFQCGSTRIKYCTLELVKPYHVSSVYPLEVLSEVKTDIEKNHKYSLEYYHTSDFASNFAIDLFKDSIDEALSLDDSDSNSNFDSDGQYREEKVLKEFRQGQTQRQMKRKRLRIRNPLVDDSRSYRVL